jgi:hypothetical protein
MGGGVTRGVEKVWEGRRGKGREWKGREGNGGALFFPRGKRRLRKTETQTRKATCHRQRLRETM